MWGYVIASLCLFQGELELTGKNSSAKSGKVKLTLVFCVRDLYFTNKKLALNYVQFNFSVPFILDNNIFTNIYTNTHPCFFQRFWNFCPLYITLAFIFYTMNMMISNEIKLVKFSVIVASRDHELASCSSKIENHPACPNLDYLFL